MSNVGRLPYLAVPREPEDGCGITPPNASIAQRRAALQALAALLDAEERAATPHPLALAVRRMDPFSRGIDQLTGKPGWV